ncbi:hypothetical protein KMP13_00370 [Epibacterium ulvae]|uniref:hypothetical protein n=1 Tax=Epibacterium ulvae TaxID=1156985 RepID=UPI001BFC65B8|nr:hypothetical protein [Epibacterium ulvae]MBT8152377.1 hypothetical protein [Epibacterium ulvae]
MTPNVAETVTFELADRITDTDFLAQIRATETFMRSCPGFIFRRLSCGADGRWTDCVIWTNMEHAQAAAKAFETQAFLPAVMATMKPGSIQMRHETIHNAELRIMPRRSAEPVALRLDRRSVSA